MATVNRNINTEYERTMAAKFVENKPVPFVMSVTDGKHRSNAQNRTQHMWFKEISEQKGDMTPEEVRAYCKLTIGIPILRSQNEAFRLRYDEILKPLSYEQKLAIMSEPLNLPVTSLMSTKQLTDYLEGIIRHFGEQGIILTMPDDLKNQINTNSGEPSQSPPDTAGEVPPSTASPATLLECAREFLALAIIPYDTPAEIDLVFRHCKEEWDGKFPDCADTVKSIATRAYAVATGRRTIDQARSFLSETLGCSIEELGGKA